MTSAQNESQALGDLGCQAACQRDQDRSPAFDDHPALAAAPAQLGAGGSGHLPGQPGGQPGAGRGQGRRRRRHSKSPLPETYVDYETSPREYTLRTISTLLDVHTRVSDLYSSPHDQVAQQLRLTIETIKERQESELVNSPEYGLLAQATPEQTIQTLGRCRPRPTTSTR